MSFGVKQAGLGIRNPVETADVLFEVSKKACQLLTDSLVEEKAINLALHKTEVRKATGKAREERLKKENKVVGERAEEKVKVWVDDGVKILASVARFPQTAFAGLAISLQNE